MVWACSAAEGDLAHADVEDFTYEFYALVAVAGERIERGWERTVAQAVCPSHLKMCVQQVFETRVLPRARRQI